MFEIKDPFWNIVSSFDLDEVFVLPEWIEKKVELQQQVVNPQELLNGKNTFEQEISNCTRCLLHTNCKVPLAGCGNSGSGILIVADQPVINGSDIFVFSPEEKDLFDKIMSAISLKSNDYYVTSIVKCFLPSNRKPTLAEAEICSEHFQKQIKILNPGVILVLGAITARALLETRQGIGLLREGFYEFQGVPLLVTYHPGALLKSPALKRPVWEDIKKLKVLLEKAHLPRSGKNE